ncbi:MAG: hypothetical protein KGH63_01935 [Candidatus Micrarchaeota archaeon]|nr:hypothetical protein [Candidatus Micrarchaeota archaeon]
MKTTIVAHNPTQARASPAILGEVRPSPVRAPPSGQKRIDQFLFQYRIDRLHVRELQFYSGIHDAVCAELEDRSVLALFSTRRGLISLSLSSLSEPIHIAFREDISRVRERALGDGFGTHPSYPDGSILPAGQIHKVVLGEREEQARGDGMAIEATFENGARLAAIELLRDDPPQFPKYRQDMVVLRFANGKQMELRTDPDAFEGLVYAVPEGIRQFTFHTLGAAGPMPVADSEVSGFLRLF